MKKKIQCARRALALAAALFCAAFTACNGNGEEEKPQGEVAAQIWTMPSTVKVLRDEDYSENYTDAPVLSFQTAKNEYESAQLMITPEKDVRDYTVTISDLTFGEHKISKENVEIYHQQYVEITSLTKKTSGRPLGYYPDALIPFDVALKAGETDIKKGANQGVWFTVYAPKDTPAGTYTGEITVTLGKSIYKVPTSVRVWDFAIPDKSNIRSSFYQFAEYLMGGQLNNTPEMYKTYVDYLLDYRISVTNIVAPNLSQEEYVRQIKEYAANEKCSAYNVGQTYAGSETELRLLIENSTPELNLLDKAFIYAWDEPYGSASALAEASNKRWIDLLISLANEYTPEQLESYGLTKEDIMSVEVLMTISTGPGEVEGLRTYCPQPQGLHTESGRAEYARLRENTYRGANNELAEDGYGTTWWYTSGVGPFEPYPTYVIDADLNSSRVISWMQHEYDIEGVLYWGVSSYFRTENYTDSLNGWDIADVYHVANDVFNQANGDGYILYPGAKYGLDTPLPSIRLMSIRDGFEDYEYLYMYEQILEEYAGKFAAESLKNSLEPLYRSLYTGTVSKTDYTLVLEARETLAKYIELATASSHTFVEIGEIDATQQTAPVSVYAEKGATLTIEGKNVLGKDSGEGVCFTYEIPTTADKNYFTATLTYGETTQRIHVFVSNKVICVADFESEAEVLTWTVGKRGDGDEHILTSLNKDVGFIKYGEGSLKVDVQTREWTIWELANYVPNISLPISSFTTATLKDIDRFEVYVYNDSDAVIDFGVTLKAKVGASAARTRRLDTYKLQPGWNKIEVSDVYKTIWSVGGTNYGEHLTDVLFEFPLLENDVTLYIDGFSCVNR